MKLFVFLLLFIHFASVEAQHKVLIPKSDYKQGQIVMFSYDAKCDCFKPTLDEVFASIVLNSADIEDEILVFVDGREVYFTSDSSITFRYFSVSKGAHCIKFENKTKGTFFSLKVDVKEDFRIFPKFKQND